MLRPLAVVSEGDILISDGFYRETNAGFVSSKTLELFSEKLLKVVQGETDLKNVRSASEEAASRLKTVKHMTRKVKAEVEKERSLISGICADLLHERQALAEKAMELEGALRREEEEERVQQLLLKDLKREAEELEEIKTTLQLRVDDLERELGRVRKEREVLKENLVSAAPVSASTKAVQAGEYYEKMERLLRSLTENK